MYILLCDSFIFHPIALGVGVLMDYMFLIKMVFSNVVYIVFLL